MDKHIAALEEKVTALEENDQEPQREKNGSKLTPEGELQHLRDVADALSRKYCRREKL